MIDRFLNKLRKESGQAVLIMVLIAAIGLIFFAVSLNWGRIAQIKTQTMIGANTAAMASASILASDAQGKWMQNLGGDRDEGGVPSHCDHTNILMAVVGLLLAIIAVVLAPFTGGCSLYLLVLAYAALAMAIINLALNVLVVQPGLTSMWNKLQKNMKPDAYFLETGIQTGIQTIATDSGQVPDLADMDTDGLFYGSSFKDEVSRYGFFYTQRLLMLQPTPIKEVGTFVRELKIFTYGDESQNGDCNLAANTNKRCCQLDTTGQLISAYGCSWQMTDAPAVYDVAQPDARNSPCCAPEYQRIRNPFRSNPSACRTHRLDAGTCHAEYIYKRIRPTNCQTSGSRTGSNTSEYLGTWSSTTETAPVICMERAKNPYNDGRIVKVPFAYQPLMEKYAQPEKFSFLKMIGQDAIQAGDNGIFGTPVDSVVLKGTYDFTALGTTRPVVQGDVFPLLWHLKDKLAVTQNSNVLNTGTSLSLVTDHVKPLTLANGASFAVNDRDTNQMPDSDPMQEISAGQYKNFSVAWWKPYTDGLCPKPVTGFSQRQDDSGWPYQGTCDSQRIRVVGETEEPIPEKWHDDVIDAIASQGPQLNKIVEQLGSMKVEDLEKDFISWYPTVAAWIAPACKTIASACVGNDIACSSACSPGDQGAMREWRLLIGGANGRSGLIKVVEDWLAQPMTGAGGQLSFCVPSITVNMSTRESGMYDRNPDNTIKQSVGNVAQCLAFHKDANVVFDRCLTQCSLENCTNLPRSLDPAFIPNDPGWQNGRAMPSLTTVDVQSSQNLQTLYGVSSPTDATREAIARLKQGTACQEGSAFLTGIQKSMDLAAQATNKDAFERRANVINTVYDKAIKVRAGLIKSYAALNAFLGPMDCDTFSEADAAVCKGHPAYALMKLRNDYRPEGLKTNNILIYGWQGPTATKNNKKYWHMARIEMKIPQLCPGRSDLCGDGNKIPWIRTKTKKFLFLPLKRCYILDGYPGLALARVTRWDEDRDEGTMVRFMNKVKLWKFTYGNPSKAVLPNDDATVDRLQEVCAGKVANSVSTNEQAPIGMTKGTWGMITNNNLSVTEKDLYRTAFMINLLQGQTQPNDSTVDQLTINPFNQNLFSIEREKECLRVADQFLRRGTSSTACAQYYWDGIAFRFAVKFVECPSDAFKADVTDYIPISSTPGVN